MTFIGKLTSNKIFILPYHVSNLDYENQYTLDLEVLNYLVDNQMIDLNALVPDMDIMTREEGIDHLLEDNILFFEDIYEYIENYDNILEFNHQSMSFKYITLNNIKAEEMMEGLI